MKRFLTISTVVLLILVIALVLYCEGMLFNSSFCLLKTIPAAEQSRLVSILEKRKQVSREFIDLTYQGYDLPGFDQLCNTFLFCEQLTDNITIERNINCEIIKTIRGNTMTIAAYDKTTYRLYYIEMTTLPVISITMLGETRTESVSDDYSYGVFTVFDSGTIETLQNDICVKTRGGSSKQLYPKKVIR